MARDLSEVEPVAAGAAPQVLDLTDLRRPTSLAKQAKAPSSSGEEDLETRNGGKSVGLFLQKLDLSLVSQNPGKWNANSEKIPHAAQEKKTSSRLFIEVNLCWTG